jgi:hypothetical protein
MKKLGFRVVIALLWIVGPLWLSVGMFVRDTIPELGNFYSVSWQAFKKGKKV